MIFRISVFLVAWSLAFVSPAQNLSHVFGITQDGVYKISKSQAQQLGFQGLTNLSIYGYPGPLPQVLDSAQLALQEIPAWQGGDELYFFLKGPHRQEITEKGTLSYTHHPYTDTLRYLLGKSPSPIRLEEKSGTGELPPSTQTWYQFRSIKEEKINILNSGRSWYSNPIRQGQSLIINFGLSTESKAPWLLQFRVLGQSTGSSSMRVYADNEMIQDLSFSPLLASPYAIKGSEKDYEGEFLPSSGKLNQLRFGYQGTGSGHVDFALVGIPFEGLNLPEGIFFGKNPTYLPIPLGKKVWEISDFYKPQAFGSGKGALGKSWIIFSPTSAKSLQTIKVLEPFFLPEPRAELIILTVPAFRETALKLKAHKEKMGIPTEVVLSSAVFTRYGYGNNDPTAIRNFLASQFHLGQRLKNVLLLGKGTFDYKGKLGGRPNLLPIYTSKSSLDPLTTYSSDDYYALLDWGQGEWEESERGDRALSIGVGRVPAITVSEAAIWVDKVLRYGILREEEPLLPRISLLADDGDNGVHMRDSEVHGDYLQKNHPFIQVEKLYLDQFIQEKNDSKQSVPALKTALENSLVQGTQVLNYVGHGNETTLAAEEIFNVQDLANWPEQEHLPLWFTATCEFGRHDSPFVRSAAEELLFAKNKGAIGIMSSGRPVFSSINFGINQAFIQQLIDPVGRRNLGEIFKNTKNKSLKGVYNRNFSLLGDPSMGIDFPQAGIRLEKILPLGKQNPVDSLYTWGRYQLHADLVDVTSQANLSQFNGKFLIEVWETPSAFTTRGDENAPFSYKVEDQKLFVGEGKILQGKIIAQFVIPERKTKEIENLRIRLHAWDSLQNVQGVGVFDIPVISSTLPLSTDKTGPEIRVEIGGKSPNQVRSIATTQVEMELFFFDPSGIHAASSPKGREMVVQINDQTPIPIPSQYRALEGSFEKGKAKILLTGLKEGKNSIRIFASDLLGNFSESNFSLVVENSERFQVLSHQVFPNPSSISTNFSFRHNRPNQTLLGTLRIYSPSGQLLVSDSKRFPRAAENITSWEWIFFTNNIRNPAKGSYIYILTIQAESSGELDTVSGKLVIQ